MAEYLTTREVARYLRIHEKKVYALAGQSELPAVRVSGKWLFPKHLIDQWMERNTVYPAAGLMGAILDEMVVIQGSDDWLFSWVVERFHQDRQIPVVSAQVGSLAGLAAVGAGKAHLAGCHVENTQVERLASKGQGCYLVTLFRRTQGLIFDRSRCPEITGLDSVAGHRLRFADRQTLSGTYRLARRLFEGLGESGADLPRTGPFCSHLELALAIQRGEADAGIGAQVAAEQCGLDFVELESEAYKLAIPVGFFSHPRLAGFLAFVLDELKRTAVRGKSGYSFEELGRMEAVGCAAA